MAKSLGGQLLLASPTLLDPNFSRTVVLIGVHAPEGAMGVVLNRPSGASVAEAVPSLEDSADALEPVFIGGPVQQSSIIFLGDYIDTSRAGLLVVGSIGFPSSESDVSEIEQATSRRRIFAGHAGWGEGQLEEELERGDWITERALAEDLFSEDPEELWTAVLERKGGSYALLARMPVDPSVN
jgi:putative transcriptional regulator